MADKLELLPDQQIKVLEHWNACPIDRPPTLGELTKLIFGPDADPRSEQGWAIKRFLASKSLVPKKNTIEKLPDVILTPEQEEYIVNNCASASVSEMTRVLFNKSGQGKEAAAIREFCQKLSNKIKTQQERIIEKRDGVEKEELLDDEIIEEEKPIKMFRPTDIEEYRPPKNRKETLERINKYTRGFDPKKIGPREEKYIIATLNYLNSYRFISQISVYNNIKDRELFESSYCSVIFDKPDLSQEEVDQYILYCGDVVLARNITQRLNDFQEKLDDDLGSDNKLSMAIVDAMKALREDLDKCLRRQTKVLQDLSGTRRERIAGEIKSKQSLVQMVEWFKAEESRQRYNHFAKLRKEALKNEINRLETLDSLVFETFGIDPNEILNS